MAAYQNLVKLCGMKTPEDLRAAEACRPDFIGLIIHYPKSPRSLSIEQATELAGGTSLRAVAVSVDLSEASIRRVISEIRPYALQLAGLETHQFVTSLRIEYPFVELWKVFHVPNDSDDDATARILDQITPYATAGIAAAFIDSGSMALPGGTGRTMTMSTARKIVEASPVPVILAGGLTPSNVADAIRTVRPAGVDVSSGIESVPGQKSPRLMAAFVDSARHEFAAVN